jgi:hypothetical protein
MRRAIGVVAWGALGVALTSALILGAFSVAGTRLTEPATFTSVTDLPIRLRPSPSHDPDRSGEPAASPIGSPATSNASSREGEGDSTFGTSLSPAPAEDRSDDAAERGDD